MLTLPTTSWLRRAAQGLPLLLCLLLSQQALRAQYGGGSGDGFSQMMVVQLTFDGIPAGITALYVGGAGDGFDHRSYTATISGADLSLLYGGGSGDGFDREVVALTISGVTITELYGGGSGDGFDRDVVSLTISGVTLDELYGGGPGDGFDRDVVSLTISGVTLDELYGGGSGDGFDRDVVSATISGVTLDELYGGGPGDGFDARKISITLSGEDLASLYGGGSGDGFDVLLFAGAIPLPLTLVSFDAFPEKEYVLLKWQTENEVATDFFTIEKTRDGQDFAFVGDTDAAGDSEPGERLHYEMRDDEPYQGTSFYRLKTTDFDGMVSLSHLIEVEYSDAESWDFTLFPNPNTGKHFSVRTDGIADGEEVTLEVFDASGRALFTEQYRHTPGEAFRFDLATRLTSGSYLVRVRDAKGGYQAKVLLVGR